jgi:pimeloyl-ACP methyl ester carboxylesterase
VLLIVFLAVTGFLYQTIASAIDAARYPAPGKLIDVGGYRLHLNCTGTGHPGSPTVILEAAFDDTSLAWSKVQPAVASFSRVCSYDRAGYGWSDTGPAPRTASHMVTELHTLLARAGVSGPIVLVGHSYGGAIMQLYAFTYQEQVAGLVLVDSVHQDQQRYPDVALPGPSLFRSCSAAAPFGTARLLGFMFYATSDYPASVQPVVEALDYQTRNCQTAADELAAEPESLGQVRAARHSLGDLPLVVLTRGQQVSKSWPALQNDLATLSTNSKHLIASHSGHYIHLEQPDLVVAAIKQVLAGKLDSTS